MSKRISFGTLSLLLITSLVACNDDGGSADTFTSNETGDPTTGDGDPTTGDGDPTTGDGDPTTGDGDPTDGPDGMFCAHQCSEDADCLIGGQDINLSCVDNFCAGESSGCTGNAECVALFSGWVTECSAAGDCPGQVCVSTDEGGRCATAPGDFVECDTFGMEEFETTDIDGNDVTVCANTAAECSAEGVCFVACQADADCPTDAYPVCNVSSGQCQCGQDSDCETLGLPANSVCNAGVCGCGADQHCVDGDAGDVCNAGSCGCTSDMACEDVPNAFDGGMVSCVSI